MPDKNKANLGLATVFLLIHRCVLRYEFFGLIVNGFIRPLTLLFFVADFYSGTHNPAGCLLFCYTKINGQIAGGGVRDDNGIVSNGYS